MQLPRILSDGLDSIATHVHSDRSKRVIPPMIPMGSAAVAMAVGGFFATSALAAPPAPPQYLNQASATSFYDSAICTTTGDVWDSSFAQFVSTGLGVGTTNAYNEVAFDFNECYGGGMIDELQALNLVPASYTSASQWNQLAWGGSRDPASGGKPISYYSLQYMKSLAAGNNVLQAAKDGYNKDLVGPVVANVQGGNPIETPQYTSSGPIGDAILPGKNDPLNTVNNNQYLAVLFAGSDSDALNFNSLNQAYSTLNNLGYAKANIYILYPGGGAAANPTAAGTIAAAFGGSTVVDATAANLQAAWAKNGTFINGKTTANTQVFYWNGMEHGTYGFNALAYIQNQISNTIQAGVNYGIQLQQQFLNQLQQTYQYFTGLGITSGLDLPTIEIQSNGPVTGLTVSLDGDSLSEIGSPVDLYGNEYEYDYQLGSADMGDLESSLNDSLDVNWSGGGDPFSGIYIDNGDEPEALADAEDVPEPVSMGLIAVGGSILLLRRRRTIAE
jgi:hypothetical protein